MGHVVLIAFMEYWKAAWKVEYNETVTIDIELWETDDVRNQEIEKR